MDDGAHGGRVEREGLVIACRMKPLQLNAVLLATQIT